MKTFDVILIADGKVSGVPFKALSKSCGRFGVHGALRRAQIVWPTLEARIVPAGKFKKGDQIGKEGV